MNRELLIHTICPHIKQWCDGEDVPDSSCKNCPATVTTSQGEGVQMCRLNAEKAADAVIAVLRRAAQPKTLSVVEAGRLYFGLGRASSYEAAKRGELPTIRIGKLIRVPVAALERMMEQAMER